MPMAVTSTGRVSAGVVQRPEATTGFIKTLAAGARGVASNTVGAVMTLLLVCAFPLPLCVLFIPTLRRRIVRSTIFPGAPPRIFPFVSPHGSSITYFSAGGDRFEVNDKERDGLLITPARAARQKNHERGETRPLVYIMHANAMGYEAYSTLIHHLYESGYDVAAYNNRGYGTRTGSCSAQTLAHDAAAFFDAVQLLTKKPTPICVYGHSLGGVTALHMAQHAAKDRSLHIEIILDRTFGDIHTAVQTMLTFVTKPYVGRVGSAVLRAFAACLLAKESHALEPLHTQRLASALQSDNPNVALKCLVSTPNDPFFSDFVAPGTAHHDLRLHRPPGDPRLHTDCWSWEFLEAIDAALPARHQAPDLKPTPR